ncbi:MAG TPA: ADP-forming succinate--CoA ligase subunit beta [Actinomycetota bacterium]|nr:ADP-forming succinate--CoA ligase subunit beta [Actinomycetota bacterium]
MDLFEYQGKELLRKFEVPIPEGRVASTPDEAAEAARFLGERVVVKAQVQVGGRGKQGGVELVATADEARAAAERIFAIDFYDQEGFALKQKADQGTLSPDEEKTWTAKKAQAQRSKRVLVERASDLRHEYYCSFLLDRTTRRYLAILSSEGGMDIEKVNEESPELIAKVQIDPLLGISDFHARELVFGGNIDAEARKETIAIMPKLYRAFVELDASQIEINPLVVTGEGKVMALDAKVILDDSAAYRHPFFDELKAAHDVPEQEKRAKSLGLNLIKLEGDVGIIGNGAGLVMSTLDVVTDAGGSPANFLDVGGGANAEILSNSLQIIMENPDVKSVLINIFGGITRCDLVAEGIIDALGRLDVKVPIVVRLDGTNAEQGRKMLADAPHPMLETAETMLEAARVAVELAHGNRS